MKKLFLLTKMLLAAAGLLVGTNAWADKEYTQVWSNDFEDAETYTSGISLTKSRSAAASTVEQYTRTDITSKAYSLYASAYNTVVTYSFTDDNFEADDYQFCMDFALQVPRNYSSSDCNVKFQIFDSNSNELFKVYLASVDDPGKGSTNLYDAGVYINGSGDAETEVVKVNTFRGGTISFYKVEITSNATDGTSLTLSKYNTSTGVLTELNTYEISASYVQLGKVVADPTGYNQTGYGKIWLDNFTLGVYSDEEIVTAPTFGDPVYAGANRTVTITAGESSKSNSVTTYYTIDGTDPSASNYAGSFTTASKDVTIESNCTVKAITISSESVSSSIASKAITVGKLTLNAPTITMTAMTENTGVYNPTYTFASDQSNILGTPTATITYSFNSGAATAGTSYAATTAGTLTVTASAEGYTSAQSQVAVKAGFVLTNAIDVADIYGGYSAYSDEWPDGLDYEMIPDVTFSPINNTQGCTYRTTHNSDVYNTLYARNKAFTATCANLTEDKVVVFADYNSNAYNPATNVSNTVTVSKNGDIKYYKLYVQPTLTQSITVSAAEWKTLCSPYSLDFTGVSGLTAYVVTGSVDGTLTLKQVKKVPAGTGILLSGSANTYNVPVIALSAATDDISGNKLVGVVANKVKEAESIYVLMNETAGVGFYKNNNAFTVGANTAYLPANFANGARSAYFFRGDITGVANVEAVAKAKAQDGKFIENGKIVIVKNGKKFNAAGAQVK